MTHLLIVRHGETLWNREHRIQGQRNSPLSPSGLRQAEALGRRLRDEGCTHLVASDLGRTMQTAQPIAAATGLAIETDQRLRERAFGVFEGCTPDEIAARHPEGHARWQAREPNYAIPGGESLNQLRERVRAALESIASIEGARASGKVIVVTHGGVLDAVYRIAAGLAVDAPRTWQLLNASLNHIEIAAGAWDVHRWGDIAHLSSAEDDFG